MKVAMVSEHASPLAAIGGVDAGGQNVHVAALARALAARGHEVTVYTRRDDARLPGLVETDEGYAVRHLRAGPPVVLPKDDLLPHMPELATELAGDWSVRRPDVAHAHFWMSGTASVAAGAATGVPVVQTFHALGTVKRRHQGVLDTSPPQRIGIERRVAADVARVVATCSDEVRELARMGVPRHRVSVVPCGVDVQHFTPVPAPGEAERPGHRPRVLVVGRLVERKGVADAISALARVPGAELLVAGGPTADRLDADPEVQRLRRVARKHEVDDRVRLLGQVDRQAMPALMRSADAVVAVPWYEPFGIVPLEAMACGRPVVASAVGGLTDTVVDGVTGVLVPPRDPRSLATALRDLLASPARRRRLGAAGLERARRHYTWQQVAARTEAVYEEVRRAAVDRMLEAPA
ncbi:MAG TPA: glycosyltransferase [Jiangellales bacterium]|nr:glycosyltransferase [Jiangellales bacterium]